MKSIKAIKGADSALRKMIVYAVLFVLAVPLLIIILLNFSRRMADLEGQDLSGTMIHFSPRTP